MPRYFVYVNENSPSTYHIRLHTETSKACGEISKLVSKRGCYPIRKLDARTIRTGETMAKSGKKTGHWLIVWAKDPLAVLDNKQVKLAEKNLNKCTCVCSKCR